MTALVHSKEIKVSKESKHPVSQSGNKKNQEGLKQILREIEQLIPPLWPLCDYVAVNPFLGFSDKSLLETQKILATVKDCSLLMNRDYYSQLYNMDGITTNDIKSACESCRHDHPEIYMDVSPAEILEWLAAIQKPDSTHPGRIKTISEQLDTRLGSDWTNHVVNDISRHCGSHFDRGQAIWESPWKNLGLFEAWRQSSLVSTRMDMLGLDGFRKLVGELPESPEDAISYLINMLEVPMNTGKYFLLAQLHSVSGWSSLIRSRMGEGKFTGKENPDLIGLLAIRLSYDTALCRSFRHEQEFHFDEPDAMAVDQYWKTNFGRESAMRYLLLKAAEISYRNRVIGKIKTAGPISQEARRKALQMIFCIDVRSEIMRRNLESASADIETFGFAGFFGMSMEYIPVGATRGSAQCPVLLEPGFKVHEGAHGNCGNLDAKVRASAQIQQKKSSIWKNFMVSPSSCFSFVESLGWGYLFKLMADSLVSSKILKSIAKIFSTPSPKQKTVPKLDAGGLNGMPNETKAALAESMLRNLGLVDNFARIVAVCGHASKVTNNPYRAGMDCGACGGHSGEPNARVAALLLNDPEVRTALSGKGIQIPDDTWFVAALHITTTDEIIFFETEMIPETHHADFQKVCDWVKSAGAACRVERAPRLGSCDPVETFRKSSDWSEVRPEWGLAGNASFIIAPRSRSAGLNLEGRTFMHSYDFQKDPGFKVLELIMTAPMIVTNWINMQYYASTVDNKNFGSGNKTIHNLVGRFGIFQGNGGDLMTGLPWQCVHDGSKFQHDPLRLLVIIEAPRDAIWAIIQRHPNVSNLVNNGWLSLVALDDGSFYEYDKNQQWKLMNQTAAKLEESSHA
jgi:uncharacterized protein